MAYTPPTNTHLSGDVTATTPTVGDNDTSVATTAFVAESIAPLATQAAINTALQIATNRAFFGI